MAAYAATAGFTPKSNVQEQNTIQQEPKVLDTHLNDLFPTRDDVGTEWTISQPRSATINNINPIFTEAETMYGIQLNKQVGPPKELTDFTLGIDQIYGYQRSFTTESVDVSIYAFSSRDDAVKVYSEVVADVIHRGGYKQISTDPQCYGAYYEFKTNAIKIIYCVRHNIYFTVINQSNANILDEKATTDIAAIVMNKIDRAPTG